MTKLREIIIDQIAKTLVKFNKTITDFQVEFTKHTVLVKTGANSVLIKLGKFTQDEIVVHYYKWINYLQDKIKDLLKQKPAKQAAAAVAEVDADAAVELVDQVLNQVEQAGQAEQVDQVDQVEQADSVKSVKSVKSVSGVVGEVVGKAVEQAIQQPSKLYNLVSNFFGKK